MGLVYSPTVWPTSEVNVGTIFTWLESHIYHIWYWTFCIYITYIWNIYKQTLQMFRNNSYTWGIFGEIPLQNYPVPAKFDLHFPTSKAKCALKIPHHFLLEDIGTKHIPTTKKWEKLMASLERISQMQVNLSQILFRFGTETTPTSLWFFDLPVTPLKFDIDTKKRWVS